MSLLVPIILYPFLYSHFLSNIVSSLIEHVYVCMMACMSACTFLCLYLCMQGFSTILVKLTHHVNQVILVVSCPRFCPYNHSVYNAAGTPYIGCKVKGVSLYNLQTTYPKFTRQHIVVMEITLKRSYENYYYHYHYHHFCYC